ncbi:hypothetical protein PMIN01_13444 [Paraphaeosphaeria minitans]|uniref:Uncharacterized protein n=1 Tax=Paraphaeosphaeria minitans TaxID=565426 RepID=A0A9P6G3W4_9PLEO|nr:hypothetical protein PMIN01_13444 [Paraphaeosphaeria minitans]
MASRTFILALLLSFQWAVEARFFNLFRPGINGPRNVPYGDIDLHDKRRVANTIQVPRDIELTEGNAPRFGHLRVRQEGGVVTTPDPFTETVTETADPITETEQGPDLGTLSKPILIDNLRQRWLTNCGDDNGNADTYYRDRDRDRDDNGDTSSSYNYTNHLNHKEHNLNSYTVSNENHDSYGHINFHRNFCVRVQNHSHPDHHNYISTATSQHNNYKYCNENCTYYYHINVGCQCNDYLYFDTASSDHDCG